MTCSSKELFKKSAYSKQRGKTEIFFVSLLKKLYIISGLVSRVIMLKHKTRLYAGTDLKLNVITTMAEQEIF